MKDMWVRGCSEQIIQNWYYSTCLQMCANCVLKPSTKFSVGMCLTNYHPHEAWLRLERHVCWFCLADIKFNQSFTLLWKVIPCWHQWHMLLHWQMGHNVWHWSCWSPFHHSWVTKAGWLFRQSHRWSKMQCKAALRCRSHQNVNSEFPQTRKSFIFN